MKVLGIDTSAIVCSVALVSDDVTLSKRSVSDGLTHSETLLPLVKEVLENGNSRLSDLDGLAISCGPGSFTGLRIGISAVKGLAVSDGIPCIGVSTLAALAMNAIGSDAKYVCAVMDARRGEFYNAIFSLDNGFPERVCEDRAIPGIQIAEEISSLERLTILGDGAEKFILQNPQFTDRIAPPEIRKQSGESVARLGIDSLKRGLAVPCKELSPKYLRLPQAEREWNEKNLKNREVSL